MLRGFADGIADYHRHDFALRDGGEGAGFAQHLQGDLPHAVGRELGHHPDGPVAAVVVGQFGIVGVLAGLGGEGRQAFTQMLGDLAGRFLGRLVADDHTQSVGFDEADVLDPGGRAFKAEQGEVIGEVGAGQLLDGLGFGFGHFLAAGIAFLPRSFGHADHGRQRAVQHLVAFVGGAFDGDAVGGAVDFQLAHVADVGQVHQLGDFGADLPGLGVAAVASADDEVGRFALQREG